ncbi:MAG: hypothetical protein Q9163_001886 [Psora crenata]
MPPAKSKGDYIETDTGNKVARRAQLHGTQHIILGGRTVIQPEVCIRGDLIRTSSSSPSTSSSGGALPAKDPKEPTATTTTTKTSSKPAAYNTTSVTIGRYSFMSVGSVLKPPSRLHKGQMVYHPLKIGDHVFVGERCVLEAASVGDHVHIGPGAVLGKMCILKDCVKVLPGAVLPAGMVVPSGSVVGGRPARVLGEVGDGWGATEGMEGGDMRELWKSVGQQPA